ncbi:MAG: hypothetical protein ACRYGK_00450 [Janthinobacterium lividum]
MSDLKLKKIVTIAPAFIEVEAEVRYWDDATVNGVVDEDGSRIPCRTGECWTPTIDLRTGAVIGWPSGTTASVHYKVCDQGLYWLLDASGHRVAKRRGHYVPDEILCIEENGYGDYIILEIGSDGLIQGWAPPEIEGDDDEGDSMWMLIEHAAPTPPAPQPRTHEVFALVHGRDMADGDRVSLAMLEGDEYTFTDGDCFVRDGDTLDGFPAEFLTLYQLEQLISTYPVCDLVQVDDSGKVAQPMTDDVSYEIVQDDMVVASASGPGAKREIMHYAAQYQQDGPLEIFKVVRTALLAAQEVK